MRGVVVIALALGASVLLPSALRAQCAEGRVQGPETAGRCCWPAQHWNDERGRCEGPPACPGGWVAEGDRCLPSASSEQSGQSPSAPAPGESHGGTPATSLPPPPAMTTSAPVTSLWASGSPTPMQPPLATTRTETTSIKGLWVTGLVMTTAAYLYSIVVGAIFTTQCCGSTAWTMFIPLVGGYIWPATEPFSFSAVPELMGIPGAGVQSLGLILTIAGAVARVTRQVPAFGPGPGDLGLAYTLRF